MSPATATRASGMEVTVPSPWRTRGPTAPLPYAAGTTSITSVTSNATRPNASLTTLNARAAARRASKGSRVAKLWRATVTNMPRFLLLLIPLALQPKLLLLSRHVPTRPSSPWHQPCTTEVQDCPLVLCTLSLPLSAFSPAALTATLGKITFGSDVTHSQAASHITCLQMDGKVCTSLSLFAPFLSLDWVFILLCNREA